MREYSYSIELHCKEGAPYIVPRYPSNIPQSAMTIAESLTIADGTKIGKALPWLTAFFDDCQLQLAFFYLSSIAQQQWLEKHGRLLQESENNAMFIGEGHPDNMSRSKTIRVPNKDVLQNFGKGLGFESQLAKMILVYIYHRWDEHFRVIIADSFSIDKKDVECDLMGDIRDIRNSIVHNNSMLEQKNIDNMEILSQIWALNPGVLEISSAMINALVEQFNHIYIRIKSDFKFVH